MFCGSGCYLFLRTALALSFKAMDVSLGNAAAGRAQAAAAPWQALAVVRRLPPLKLS
jgi:hypothetical protein